MLNRRLLLKSLPLTLALPTAGGVLASRGALPNPPSHLAPDELAQDENFWAEVAGYYDRTQGITNLEHGYWGKMAAPVQDAFVGATRMVNQQNSFYARKQFDDDALHSRRRIAHALGSEEDEIVITRNATEAIHNLLRQYTGLKQGDAILYADVDYPNFKLTTQWLAKTRGCRAVELQIPTRSDQATLHKLYVDALESNPDIKLMLITHVSNQHGLRLPVPTIAAVAKERGIDVICDAAQSWGLLDYKVPDLGVDWAGFNLHKWIGAPVGVGALYLRRGSLEKIAPYPGESDPENNLAEARVNMATSNFASILTIPAALAFHESLGSANKEARLRYLRQLWTREADSLPGIEVLGGIDEESWSGIGSFRITGRTDKQDAIELQQRLEREFGIFAVARHGLSSGSCVRITPQVFSTPTDMAGLVNALKRIAA